MITGKQPQMFNARDKDLLRWKSVNLLRLGHYRQALEILERLHIAVAQPLPEGHGQWQFLVQLEQDISLAYANLGFYTLAKKHLATAQTAAAKYLGEAENTIVDQKAAQKQVRKLGAEQDNWHLVQCVNYSTWGYYDKALDICQSTLEKLEATWWPQHPKTLEWASRKAILLAHNGRIFEADRLCDQAWSGLSQHFGLEHPLSLEATAHMIFICKSQYELQTAIDTAGRLYQDASKLLGKQHPLTTTAILLAAECNLAFCDYCQAVGVLGTLLETSKDLYGNNCVLRLRLHADYARALYHLGLFKEAEDQVATCLHQQHKLLAMGILSSDPAPSAFQLPRPDSNSLENFEFHGHVQSSAPFIGEAIKEMRTQANGSKSRLLRMHPLHLFSLETLAMIEKEKANWELVRSFLRDIWHYRARTMGENHPDTLMARFEFAAMLRECGTQIDLEQAVGHFHQILMQRRLTLEEEDDHPEIIAVRRELMIAI